MAYNYETNRTSQNYTPASSVPSVFGIGPRTIEGITIHWWGDPNQNPSFDGITNYLLANGSNTSAHFVATGTGRRVACIVDLGDVAHHAGSGWGNVHTIGIELDPRARDEDYDVAAELVADIRSAYGDVPIYWHNYFINTACPGVWSPERLDALSYTKYSHATDWGRGGNKTEPAPVAPTPVPAPVPAKELYKLTVDGKQVGAYSTEQNAYSAYVFFDKKAVIKLAGKDVTSELVNKFTAPSPTTQTPDGAPLPDTGLPVAEKDDYAEENNGLLKQILAILKSIFKL